MILEYKNWPGKRIELTKAQFEKLGPRKKLFTVIDEKDSTLSVKQQIISNQIGTGGGKKSVVPNVEAKESKQNHQSTKEKEKPKNSGNKK